MAKKRKRKKRRKSQKGIVQEGMPQIFKEEELQIIKPRWRKPLSALFALFVIVITAFLIAKFLILKDKIKKDSGLNVLLVTLDTTRADRLGCYGYEKAKTPNLDFLASNGVQFLNAYCQVPLTTPSHCSILTGTYPLYHQVRNNGSYVLPAELMTLAEKLKERGLKTAAFVASFTVDSRLGLDQGFDHYDDNFVEGQAFKSLNSERNAERVFAVFSRWLNEIKTEQFFSWVHFFDPHLPYDPPSPFKEEFADSPYDGEIAYMDYYVGKVVEQLREKNLLRNTLIILAGDHGEAFGEKEEAGHGIFLYEPTMRVPLIFYAENHLPAGVTIKPRVRLIDIMPSILEMLELPLPIDIQGTSLLPYIRGKKNDDLPSYIETFFPRENYGWSELKGLIDGDWKYIHAPMEELYNLRTDPGEAQNTSPKEQKILEEKREKLKAIISKSSSPFRTEKRQMTVEERERLRSLGYTAYAEEIQKENLPDPKDMIEELRLITQAESYEFGGEFQRSAEIYEKILTLRPETPSSYVNLALVFAKMGRFEEAISILQRGLGRIPGSEILMTRLGHTYMVIGRLKKALEAMQTVLEINPKNFDALLASGWILDFMGQKEEARGFYEKAFEVEPENKFLRKNYAMNLAATGKIPEAIGIYENLKRDYPDDHEIYQDLGIAYGYANDLGRSIDNLKKAVSLRPTPVSYYNLAVALKKVGSIEEAVGYLKLYLEDPEGEDEASIKAAQLELNNLERILKH